MSFDVTSWTYGAEHEFADWDNEKPLPDGFLRSPDKTIVNSNGVAAQPNPKDYRYGGEINTPPSDTIGTQIQHLRLLKRLYHPTINYRSNLHIHIRVPGLKKDLTQLKQVQWHIHHFGPDFLRLHLPLPTFGDEFVDPLWWESAMKKRYRRNKVSHRTFLTRQRVEKQQEARTVEEFFESEVPRSKAGKVMWHAQPRVCINLRQLRETDTIEFRCFPGTLDDIELQNAFVLCQYFIVWALSESQPKRTISPILPRFKPFNIEQEILYQATCHSGIFKARERKENIAAITTNVKKFWSTENYAKAKNYACNLPW